MKSILIHGCYDSKTLENLLKLGATEFAFDLRGRSLNLIPFHELKNLLGLLTSKKVFLSFANDRIETINSYISLLKDFDFEFVLIFRDSQNDEFYKNIKTPFYWMFHPEGNWKSILQSPYIQGVMLPLSWNEHYQGQKGLWGLIEKNNLDVYIHAENFEDTAGISLDSEVKLGLDLTQEIETSFRSVDQRKLSEMKIWRRLNANSTGQ
jgi:hypothetical protein